MEYKVLNGISLDDLSPDARNGVLPDYFAVLDANKEDMGGVHFISIVRTQLDQSLQQHLNPEEQLAHDAGDTWEFATYYKVQNTIVGYYGFMNVEFGFEKVAEMFAEVSGRGGAFHIGPKDNFDEARNVFVTLQNSGEVTKAIERYAIDGKGAITVGGFNPEERTILDYAGDDYWGRPTYELFGSHVAKEVEGRLVSFNTYVKDTELGRGGIPSLHWSSPQTYFEGEPDYPFSSEKPLAFVSTQGRELPENAKAANASVRETKGLDKQMGQAQSVSDALEKDNSAPKRTKAVEDPEL